MIWSSWNDFLAMGGNGAFVWGSVLVVLGAVGGELVLAVWRHRVARAAVRRQAGARR